MQLEPPPPPPVIVRRKDPRMIAAVGILAIVVIALGIYIMTLPIAPPTSIVSDDDVILLAGNITETITDINNTLSFLEETIS
jgi:hypothetical protein